MPVQINEIIIRAVVAPPPVNSSGGNQPSPASSNNVNYEAVEKVLEIIKEKLER